MTDQDHDDASETVDRIVAALERINDAGFPEVADDLRRRLRPRLGVIRRAVAPLRAARSLLDFALEVERLAAIVGNDPPLPVRTPATHDYTEPTRRWGHNLGYRVEGDRLEAHGWGDGIVEGDFLLLSHPGSVGGSTVRYRVESIAYASDPTDMWFARLKFAPRTPEEIAAEPRKALTSGSGWHPEDFVR